MGISYLIILVVFFNLSEFKFDSIAVLILGFLSYILISLLVVVFELPAFTWLATNSIPAILVAIPVLFAPEIRRALERLGRASDDRHVMSVQFISHRGSFAARSARL